MFKKILETQQEAFRSFMQTYMDCTNKRIDNFIQETTRSITELKSSLEFSQAEILDMKTKQNLDSVQLKKMSEDLNLATVGLKKLEDSCDYLENQSRRNNLRIDRIPENQGETWAQTEDLVKDKMRTALDIPEAASIEVDRAHRTKGGENRNRTIIVKFTKLKIEKW